VIVVMIRILTSDRDVGSAPSTGWVVDGGTQGAGRRG
jgi:hypothetical protein